MSKRGQCKIETSYKTSQTACLLVDTSLLFLNRVRSKNPLKEGRFWKFSKVSARRSWKTWKGLGEISRAKKSANPCTDDMSLSRTALYLRSVEASFPRCKTNPKHYPDRGGDTSLVWNFCARSSDVISARGNQWWRRELLAVFSDYWKLWHCTVLSIYQHQNVTRWGRAGRDYHTIGCWR